MSNSRNDALRAALQELVALKDIKDKLDKIEPPRESPTRNYHAEELREDYDRRKPLAWQAARQALAAAPPCTKPSSDARAVSLLRTARKCLAHSGDGDEVGEMIDAFLASVQNDTRRSVACVSDQHLCDIYASGETHIDGLRAVVQAVDDGMEDFARSETPQPTASEAGWYAQCDGCSLNMLVAPSGRVFRLQELGVGGAQWGNADDNDELCERIAAALRADGGSKAPEGWKLVREFPTVEQQVAGEKAAGGTLATGFIVGIYRAMLFAAPSPSVNEQDDRGKRG